MAVTIISNLDYIMNEPPHCNDRVLQKSMIGQLHQWMQSQNVEFLPNLDAGRDSSSILSMFKTTQRGSLNNSQSQQPYD